jgi:hypothetical protein
MSRERYDHIEIKRRLAMLDLLAHEGIAARRAGPHHVAVCPFHAERSGSFTIYTYDDHAEDHAHCFGCGWNGDIIDFWRERHGGGFLDALPPLASLASVSPSVFEAKRKQAAQVPRVTEVASETRQKPPLPRLRALTDEEVQCLATLRKLSVAGVAAAAADKRVGGCEWPQWIDHHGCWRVADDATTCWVVTDHERAVAQFRRLDGAGFVRRDGKTIKAWTKGSPTWPLGAADIGERADVLLVEGGADMLAGYHFLAQFRRLKHVAVCAMLGASMRIADDALPHFRRKRVRIVMDEDEAKDERGIRPGCEAAARWTAQLVEAGAAVETFSLAGLLTKDGGPVKDLNDLAVVDEAAWLDGELREAFFDFDF